MASVFLDVGGTIVDFRPNYFEPIYGVLHENGYNVELKTIFRTISSYLGSRRIKFVNGNPVINFDDFLDEIKLNVDSKTRNELLSLDLSSSTYSIYPDTTDFLDWLGEKGFRLHIISNASEKLHNVLDDLDLRKYFSAITISYEVGAAKPSETIFKVASQRAGEVGPFIGDIYEVDYLGGKNAGFAPILIDRYGFYGDLKGVQRVRNLAEAKPLIEGIFNSSISPKG
ncbi:MAG: HAD-IA family hydrolase [Nitrososphaerota archaeon]|jgi:putative hydrolase of the HAD superfamily|nr:HAD-IA family hydrolase [Nitrososphaerota archaeon]MDG6927060.1 HAD-IA family hydrolase [Nitrososphaerota archaeon]MDG6930560.1 HAD-IA family hydrolase [Nitrososphaerota archaeon]MDG6932373.1 HAD-IA family hydrolase [Nitrososphaerota archaeon]MDG6935932.1 HAD-IA family hydrolase [Nitrososphaerota archaeon]